MPCYDPETHEYPKRLAAKVNALTELLCATCKTADPGFINARPWLRQWWENHQIIDAKIAAAKAKRARNEPLTTEEFSLLFCERE